MNAIVNRNQPINVQDYYRGWEKAQREYQRQFENKSRKTVGKTAKKVRATFNLILLLFLFSLPFYSQAQNLTQTIRGRILDRESQAPLIGAAVVITSTNPEMAIMTDADGYFKLIKVPVGRHTLKITYLGYEDQVVPELLLGSGKELVLNIGLAETINQMKEVVIKAETEKGRPQNEMAVLSARTISVEETKRYAASLSDPARAALNYAGVGSTDDGSNEIVVRGNSPKGVLWRLEGMEIPNPNHFGEEGASGGPISILSVNMIDNSDFYTGAFPAEYGNALSGIFDMKLRKGNNEKREYAFQAGVLGVDFAVEGPFKKGSRASYLANYRYSTLAIMNKIGIKLDGDDTPDFQDFSFKVNVPTEKVGIFSAWGISGLSSDVTIAKTDPNEWTEKEDHFNDVFRSGMATGGLSHVYFLNNNAYLETNLSYSRNFSSFRYDSLNTQLDRYLFNHDRVDKSAVRGSVLYNHKLNAQHTIRFGAIYSNLDFDLFSEGRNEKKQMQTYIDNAGSSGLLQGFGQWKYRLRENLTLNTGMHFMRLGLNGSTSIEPRAGLRWNLNSAQALGFGFGVHSRHESMAAYFAQQPLADGSYSQANKKLDLAKARHFVVSYDVMLREDLRFKAETYYQDLYNVAISSDPKSTFATINTLDGISIDSLVSTGTGKNYGVELSLEKFLTNNYYFLATTSLYNSKYTAADGVERNTRFNGNYIVNVLAGKEFKVGKGQNNLIGVNVKGLWAGGNRYTPIDLERSRQEGKTVYQVGNEFEAQADAYFRSDIRLSYRKNRPKASYIVSLDIQNVTNRLNMYRQYYDKETQEIVTTTQMGMLPVLNYRIEF